MDKVGIILVNYKNSKDTIECLENIKKLNYPTFEVVIVDNNSQDESSSIFSKWIDINQTIEVKLISAEVNHGFAAGNNLAISYLINQNINYFWFLNNDTVVDSYSLSSLMAKMKQDNKIGFVGSKLLFYNNTLTIQAAGGGEFYPYYGHSRHYGEFEEDKGQWDKTFEPFYINGASLLTKREVIEDIGYMNESFFMYGEEVDWQIKAKAKGWKLAYAFDSKIYHKVSASIEEKSKKYFTYYYITRNSIIITRKYYKSYLITVTLFNFVKCFSKVVKGDFSAAKGIFKGIKDAYNINLETFYKNNN